MPTVPSDHNDSHYVCMKSKVDKGQTAHRVLFQRNCDTELCLFEHGTATQGTRCSYGVLMHVKLHKVQVTK